MGGFGYVPMVLSVDYGKENRTGEVFGDQLRTGNKTVKSAQDHIQVLAKALEQLPDAMSNAH